MSNISIDILGTTSDDFVQAISLQNISRDEALRMYRRAFRHGQCDSTIVSTHIYPIVNQLVENGTTKFVQQIENGLETESVILPIRSRFGRIRTTLCVSSQIGCARGCIFCETAQMGLMKNLTASQIVGQWFAARFSLKSPIDNIVFMGMGEPMDNLDEVLTSIRIFTDRNGPCIASARISVSTVGHAPGILRLAEFARQPGFHRLCLAVSLNAPNDEIRSRIMPTNRATPMAELMNAMKHWPLYGTRRLLIEYVLIPGVNDRREHARELCEYLRPLPCKVNVIPYNPRRDSPWPAPTNEEANQFTSWIAECGQFVTRRQTFGRSVMAACGQLGNATIRKRKYQPAQLSITGT